ncbi:GTP-binding protein Rho1, partial [Chytriomyces hyalinus]
MSNFRVWTAKDRETDSVVMIKCFDSKEDPSNETRNYQINLEANTLRELSNMNPSRIVTFISFHHEERYTLLAMEMARCSLEEALSVRPRLPESETKGIIQCVLEALVTCHSNQIAHRNVTPNNLFLINDNLDDLKLGGFDKCAKDNVYPSCVGFVGTEGYMAPEQMGPIKYGRPVDIWAAGVIAYQLCYGSLPYPGLSAAIHARDTAMPKLQFPVSFLVSKAASEFMQLLLSDNPDDRPSASEALQHPWFTGVTHAIHNDGFSKIRNANPSGATQAIVPMPVATNHAPIKKPQQAPITLSQKTMFETSGRSKSTILGTNNIPAKEKPDPLSAHNEAVMEIPASDIHIDHSKLLGKGAFGIVYAATYKTRNIAVKCIFGLDSDVAHREFEHEARQMSRLKHKNIVPMLGISFRDKTREIVMGSIHSMQESDAPMLVMERMSTSVYNAIGSIPPPPMESRVRWVRQTASAFCYLHHECNPPVLHLDLKPNNILIDSKGNAQLADFGLARVQRMTSSYASSSAQTIKHGAYLYAPPESFKLKYRPTTKHDVYCFAMTSYHIIGLHPPFHDESNIAFSRQWVQQNQRPERSEQVKIPDDCWTLIVKCWDHDAAIRPSFIQIVDSIGSWITESEEDEAKPPPDNQNHFWDMLHISNEDTLFETPPKTLMVSPQICDDSSLGRNNSCNKEICPKCGMAVDGPHITFEGNECHFEHFSCEAKQSSKESESTVGGDSSANAGGDTSAKVGGDSSTNASGDTSINDGTEIDQIIQQYMEDLYHPVIATKHDTLMGDGPSLQTIHPLTMHANEIQPEIVNETLKMRKKKEQQQQIQHPQMHPRHIQSTQASSSTQQDSKANRLARMFATPYEMMYEGSFAGACREACHSSKWILVTVSDRTDFACEVQKHDLWNSPLVREFVSASFVFLFYPSESPDGMRHASLYQVDALPYFAILDPRTGESMEVWTTTPKKEVLLQEFATFLDLNSLNLASVASPGSGSSGAQKVTDLTGDDDTYQYIPDHFKANLLKCKLAVVGDGACGKSCLQKVFTHQLFPTMKFVDNFETYTTTTWIEESHQHVNIEMFDCSGMEDYDRMRPLSYEGANVVLLVFSVDWPDSLANVWEKWLPEIKHYQPMTPIILVALKIDLRTDKSTLSLLAKSNEHPVTTAEGQEMAQKIGAMTYLECSALTGEGVNQVYKTATLEA